MPRDLAPIDVRRRTPTTLSLTGTPALHPSSSSSSSSSSAAAAVASSPVPQTDERRRSAKSRSDRDRPGSTIRRRRCRRRPATATSKQQRAPAAAANQAAAKPSRRRSAKRRTKDFILRRAPAHSDHWTPDHVRDILRAKIECRSKRRENRNTHALQLLGGSAKDAGITARQLRRRCLRHGIPLSRVQSEELFRSIEGGTGATSMSLHRFLLGLFPEDYDADRIADLRLNQTLMGMSEIERTTKLGVDWQTRTKINRPTLRWPPGVMLKKLQQQIVKRGGGLAEALKRYSVIRKDEKSATSGTTLGTQEMREVIARIFRIPASEEECDVFFSCLAHHPNGRITFAELFRKLDGGVVAGGRVVPGNLGPTVSDIIGGAEIRDNNSRGNGNGDAVSEAGSEESWVSLASTRVPSIKAGFAGGGGGGDGGGYGGGGGAAAVDTAREEEEDWASSYAASLRPSLRSARSMGSDRSRASLRSLALSISAAAKKRKAARQRRRPQSKGGERGARPSSAAPSLARSSSSQSRSIRRGSKDGTAVPRKKRPGSAAPSRAGSSRNRGAGDGDGSESHKHRPSSAAPSRLGMRDSRMSDHAYFTLGTVGTAGGAQAENVISMAIASAAHFRRLRTLAKSHSAAAGLSLSRRGDSRGSSRPSARSSRPGGFREC